MKLPNSFGSVYKLSGNRRNPWAARKTTGWQDNGQPIYHFVGFYPSKKEALTALVEYNKDPYDLSMAQMTFDDVFEKWSESHFHRVKAASINGYMSAYRCCDKICHMRMTDIKLAHLQAVIDESGKNTPMLKLIKNMLGLMWDYAVMHEIVTPDKREMVRYLDVSKPGNPNQKGHHPFSKTEIDLLWKHKDDNPYVGVILAMIYTGVRIGELLVLKKEDVHLDERWMYIRAAKTSAGVREVPIAEKIVPIIQYWIDRPCDYLICTPEGKPFNYMGFKQLYFDRLMNSLAMEHRPHDTRHTCISLLAEKGVDQRIIQKIVGHKGTGVTEAVYTHFELQTKLDAINQI